MTGVKHISSTINLGASVTNVQLEVGTDPQKAADDMRTAVDKAIADNTGKFGGQELLAHVLDDLLILLAWKF